MTDNADPAGQPDPKPDGASQQTPPAEAQPPAKPDQAASSSESAAEKATEKPAE